jgi:hypothetical protein
MNLDGIVTPAEKVRVKLLLPAGKTVSELTIGSPLYETHKVAYKKSGSFIEFEIPAFEIYSLATVYLNK